MTGGQMAPTSLLGQKTETSPYWKRCKDSRIPYYKLSEMIGTLQGAAYVEGSVDTIPHIAKG